MNTLNQTNANQLPEVQTRHSAFLKIDTVPRDGTLVLLLFMDRAVEIILACAWHAADEDHPAEWWQPTGADVWDAIDHLGDPIGWIPLPNRHSNDTYRPCSRAVSGNSYTFEWSSRVTPLRVHHSDCALHNEPALKIQPCDCVYLPSA